MKSTSYIRILCCGLLMISNVIQASSQSLKEFFKNPNTTTVWLGLDFSETRIFGDPNTSALDIKERYFNSINELILSESQKYNVSKSFRRTNLTFDLSQVQTNNSKVDPATIAATNPNQMARMNEAMVEKIVKGYNINNQKGFGIVFLVESLDKTSKSASMYVTIFDLETKNVLLTKRMTAKPGGFGFRNYWGNTIYEILKQIEKREYKKWGSESN